MNTSVIAIGYQQQWWDILTSHFMQNALLGGTLVALSAGLIGYFTVVRNSAFAAHALAHIGFPGATGAVLLGLPVTLGLAVFCIGGALVIGALGKRADDREVATGTVLAAATGLGLFFGSLATKGSSTVTNVLFGNLLAVTDEQLLVFAAAVVVLAAVIAFVYRPLLFASVNAEVAEAKGVPVRLLSVIFMVLLGLAVTMAVQAVGTLLLFALVVTPAATAIMLTARPGVAMALSTALSVFSVWLGLTMSAMFNLPPSFVIVTIVTLIWLLVWAVAHRTDGSRRTPGAGQGVGSATEGSAIG
ncbi:metal ABC transporter permease [[Mycobacterium] burgundiense]|uniref:Metal ABC transporter permease n=1 Tax=[Mycobacterium] burgundiense TaxID=3064286 RepID=A0ABM9L9Y7_9MYCO|nr:metal ABC transporter permease [Mycolicibacterium sp. MU0053]CAJ1495443.1 metal ABC transporter permease [Mycolicibacterium sp. MU0053]